MSWCRATSATSSTLNEVTQGMDAVIHMATLRITACAAEPREALEVMCDGSFNVLEAAQAAGVKKVVTASSASIYGLADTFPTREDHHPYNNRTWYGASKIMLEGLLRSFNDMYGLPYVALRYFNVYGPRMDIHGKYTEVLIRWMERIAAGQPPLILGDGKQTMDFVYIDDVARANVLALQSDVSDEVFNVASGTETSLNELAAALLRVMGSEPGAGIRPRAQGQPGVAPPGRHRQGRATARLPRRGRPRGGPAASGRWWWRDATGQQHCNDPDHQAGDGRGARPRPRAASS